MKIKTIRNQKELDLALSMSEGFMVGITLKEKGDLYHYLLTKDFPKLDMLKSLTKIKGLVIEGLENLETDDTPTIADVKNEKVEDAELIFKKMTTPEPELTKGEEDVEDTE